MVVSSPTASSSSVGRERALEVLMDRDPLGSYYRAARVAVRAFVVVKRMLPVFIEALNI